VKEGLLTQIEQYDFLGCYNYAYLISELEVSSISEWIVAETIKRLTDAVLSGDYQICLQWARFLGELYKYQLIKRSFLFEQIQKFLEIGKSDIGVVNLVCTILETCQGYLESKRIAGKNQLFMLLVEFKVPLELCRNLSTDARIFLCWRNSRSLMCLTSLSPI
jgi:hypothetical protein